MSSDYRKKVKSLFPSSLALEYPYMKEFYGEIVSLGYREKAFDEKKKLIKCIYFPNVHAFCVDKKIYNELLNIIDDLKEKTKAQRVVLFNLTPNELMSIQNIKKCPYYFFYSFECNIQDYYLKSNLKRKSKKAKESLKLNTVPSETDFIVGLDLYYKMDYADKELDCIDRNSFAKFYLNNEQAIAILCHKDSQIVGIMLGFLWKEKSYMHIFYYDKRYTRYYISDFLYQEFIKISKEKGAKCVEWGDVEPLDDGLYNFKKHYSTSILKKYICYI